MSSATRISSAFSERELSVAVATAVLLQFLFFALLVWAGKSEAQIKRVEPPTVPGIPISVTPVLDDLPLLKLGSKNRVKKKLPDMWKKAEPSLVKRYEERSAPSTKAEDKTEELPTSPLADADHEAPKEDDPLAKEVDQKLEEAENPEEPVLNQEGEADGSKDGTETDPLKARWRDQYKQKILGWLQLKLKRPTDEVPCEELQKLSSSATVFIGPDRVVTQVQVSAASGNAAFDKAVQSAIGRTTGSSLPPPPPLYGEIQFTELKVRYSGDAGPCAAGP